MYAKNDPMSLERYSSAVTLSDMEVFIFPELMYSLVLANMMSKRIWNWKNDSWFEKLEKQNPQRRMQRLKQYIMDHFAFNLDLDTWGLTTKPRELSRFSAFIDEGILAQSNALFGYEGDKYYFDIDIRKHFGLDKYTTDIIPYWKTETIEAMEAFRYKDGYESGAGECVSLAALYASAAFIVAQIPLDTIYFYATPLHSQVYFDISNGIIANNRRIVTKNMWFNGTELSGKARRALEHEKITIVAHRSGYIHTIYDSATIAQSSYKKFRDKLHSFCKAPIDYEILSNFLRQNSQFQKCFQIIHSCCGKPRFIESEKVFHYEHSSKARVGDTTQNQLLHEIEEDEYYPDPLPNRLLFSELENFFKQNGVIDDNNTTVEKLKTFLHHGCPKIDEILKGLKQFSQINPRLPDSTKAWVDNGCIDLDGVRSPEEVIEKIEPLRSSNMTVDLAFTAFRDLSRSAWRPFLKAALERNPVALNAMDKMSIDQAYSFLESLDAESIYDESFRLAQPDEVVNFGRGDGLEKAISLINHIKNAMPQDDFELCESNDSYVVKTGRKEFRFPSNKKVPLPERDDFAG
ncbi:MAG: hypothetical protein JW915_06090 [Chitinispirillaceae bacterium]|nr:hypothetical protein [Chitinispirillaceae bacterium]